MLNREDLVRLLGRFRARVSQGLSADFFQAHVATACGIRNHTDPNFSESQTALAESAREINDRAQREQNAEAEAEKQLRSEQFPNKIELQNEKDCKRGDQTFAKFRLPHDTCEECLDLIRYVVHVLVCPHQERCTEEAKGRGAKSLQN